MWCKTILVVLMFGAMAFAQVAAPPDDPVQSEMQRLRRSMQQLQQQLDTLIEQTRALQHQAATGRFDVSPPAEPPAPKIIRPTDSAEQLQRALELLERIDQRQEQLDAQVGVMQARQSVLEKQVDQVRKRLNTQSNNPYAYRPPTDTSATAAVPSSQMPTTMNVTTAPTYTVTDRVYPVTSAAPQTVVYTERYVYPRVWQGGVYVVPWARRYPRYWYGCGVGWGWGGRYHHGWIRHSSHRRSHISGGIHVGIRLY